MLVWIVRIVAVVALLGVAAAIATPRGRLPLALRGVRRIMRRDRGLADARDDGDAPVPLWKRLLAFVFVLAAALVALV